MAFIFFTAKEFTPISPMCPAPPHHDKGYPTQRNLDLTERIDLRWTIS